MNIIKKIDSMRISRGWSFYKLSQESGLSQQTFTKWSEGKTTPTINTLQLVCDAFGITLSDFFCDGEMVEVTPETKKLYDDWCCLTKDEKQAIKLIVQNFKNKKL